MPSLFLPLLNLPSLPGAGPPCCLGQMHFLLICHWPLVIFCSLVIHLFLDASGWLGCPSRGRELSLSLERAPSLSPPWTPVEGWESQPFWRHYHHCSQIGMRSSLGLGHSSCVTLWRLFNLSEPSFPFKVVIISYYLLSQVYCEDYICKCTQNASMGPGP